MQREVIMSMAAQLYRHDLNFPTAVKAAIELATEVEKQIPERTFDEPAEVVHVPIPQGMVAVDGTLEIPKAPQIMNGDPTEPPRQIEYSQHD